MARSDLRLMANDCLQRFRLLFNLETQVYLEGKADEVKTDDQLSRYQMWAGNIGAFADGHASLDHRLRDNDNVRRMTISFLQHLRDFLQRAMEALKAPADDDNITDMLRQTSLDESPTDAFHDSVSSHISSSFQGTETDSVQDLLLQNPYKQRLQEVERTIDRLYRLSLLIRQPAIATQNSKAESFVITDEEGNDINESFAAYCLKFISHQFPGSSETLRDRLAKGNTLRRKRFLYRQSHQRKLSAPMNATTPKDSQRGSYVGSTVRGTRTPVQDKVNDTGPKPQKIRDTGNLSQTSASALTKQTIPIAKVEEDTASKISTLFTATLSHDSPVVIPDPPWPSPGSKEFECPYCCMILPVDQAKASRWRRHVLEDLEPYVCVFEQCPEHRSLFRERRTWLSHMQKAHTNRWVCTSSGHPASFFDSDQAYEQHMRTEHDGTFTESQLPVLIKRSKVPAVATFEQCPLCGYQPSESEVKRMTANQRLDVFRGEAARISSELIARHLASHLESISVRALPWQDSLEDPRAENPVSKRAEEGNSFDDGGSSTGSEPASSPLSFVDAELKRETISWPEKEDGAVVDVDEVPYKEEWSFIPLPVYHGHDRDPVLQALLRKLYLDTSHPFIHGRGPLLPAYLVPVDCDKNFVGRDLELKTIRENLINSAGIEGAINKPPSFPRCFTIYGPGGLGKTQVAAQFVAKHRNEFDAILWVHAENSSKMAQNFKDIAISLGLISERSVDAMDLNFTRDAVKRWLINPIKDLEDSNPRSSKKASWLLVFDGVEEPNDLNEFWPYDGPGSILVTSRNPYSWSASLFLKPLSIAESTSYLLAITKRQPEEVEQSAVSTIAGRLGGLPLALAQMGNIIVHKSLSFTQFLSSYEEKESQQQLLHWMPADSHVQTTNYEHNIASVWAFDSLTHSTSLLKILSILDPDGIPESIFLQGAAEGILPDISSLSEYKKARNELLARSLVTTNSREKKLFIHRLVQDVAFSRMRPPELRAAFVACVQLVSARWPFEPFTWRHGIARWAACEELFPHVHSLKETFQDIPPSSDSLEDYIFVRLLVEVGWYHFERGKFTDIMQYNNMAQSICESLKLRLMEDPELGADGKVTLADLNYTLQEITNNRGIVATELHNQQDSLKYQKHFNAMMIKELKDKPPHDDMRLAISWNELGNAYMLDRSLAKGEECFQNSISEMRKLTNFVPISLSLPIANLGLAHWMQGRNEQAARTLLQGLHDREAALGVDDRDSFVTGRLLYALGNVMSSQNRHDDGLDLHRRALLLYKSTLGNRHHRTADAFVKVAEHHVRLHQFAMALALLDHAIDAYSYSNNFVPEKARAAFLKTKALRALGKSEEADTERTNCFKIYSVLYGERVREGRAREVERKRDAESLEDEDFDNLMVFWSR